MDYSQLSDGELSVRLAYFLKPKYSAVVHPNNSSGVQLSRNWLNTVQNTGYFPLHNADDLFRVVKKHRIALEPAGKTIWKASHEAVGSAKHRNPLRAVAIVFLMMQESSNA